MIMNLLNMNLGPHATFIIASYIAAIAVIAGLIVWIAVDYRLQRRKLSDFETRGVTRRSTQARPAS